ncbi:MULTISPECIES: LPFR motif small protein [unclassified Streptomyces]|uniref:LPFR motif small protein n=1 Tax=unclassified Streptomyces TaxID=2593676 RepID=UPI003330BCA2
MFRAIADVLRQIGAALATVVTLPFRAVARLFGGASSSTRRSGRRSGGRTRGRAGRARRV